jgi:hypothetical protein
MSLKNLSFRHLRLISLYGTRYAIRGGTGLVFVMLVLFFGLIVAHMLLTPVERMKVQIERESGREMTDAQVMDQLIEVARPGVQWVIAGKTPNRRGPPAYDTKKVDWSSYLLEEKPALLSAVLLIMLFATPFLVALGSFNQFSGDIQSKGLRYQLLRSARTNIFFGRFLGTVFYTVAVNVLLVFIIALYLGLKLDIYSSSALISWSLRGILALAVVSIPYVAFCSWISGAIDSPFGSLTISSLIVGGVPLFALLGKKSWEPVGYLKYALPWGVQNYLLHPNALYVLGTAAACGGYTVLFLLLGHRHFVKRDL